MNAPALSTVVLIIALAIAALAAPASAQTIIFSEDFTAPSGGWWGEDNSGDGQPLWGSIFTPALTSWGVGDITGLAVLAQGNALFQMADTDEPSDDWEATPAIPMTAGNSYTIDYVWDNSPGYPSNWRAYVTPTRASGAAIIAQGTLLVERIASDTSGVDSWAFVPATTGDYYLAWHDFTGLGSPSYPNMVIIDNIVVTDNSATSTAPDIALERASVPIPSGGSDALGNVSAGSPTNFTYTVQNTGTGPLTVSGVTVTPSGVGNCSVASTVPASPIAASGSATFVVTVTPTVAGAFQFSMSIANDDPDPGESPYLVTVTGTGTTLTPDIAVERGASSIPDGGTDPLGNVPISTAQNLTYTIRNTGAGPLQITGAVTATVGANCTINSVTQPTSPIAAGGNATFDVNVTVTAANPFNFAVNIPNDDPDEAPYDFTVSGTGTPPPPAPEIDIQVPAGAPVVNGGLVNLGTHEPLVAITRVVTIANFGTATLTLSSNPTTAPVLNATSQITVNPTSLTIAAGSTGTFTIEVTPQADGNFGITFTVSSDDADEGVYIVSLGGIAQTVVPPPTTSGSGGGCCTLGASAPEAMRASQTLWLLALAFLVCVTIARQRRP